MQGNCQSCTAHARSLIPSLSVTPVRFCDCFLNWRAASAAAAITSNLSWQQCVPSRPCPPRDPVNLSIATHLHLTGPCHSLLPLLPQLQTLCCVQDVQAALSLYLFICNFLPPPPPPLSAFFVPLLRVLVFLLVCLVIISVFCFLFSVFPICLAVVRRCFRW